MRDACECYPRKRSCPRLRRSFYDTTDNFAPAPWSKGSHEGVSSTDPGRLVTLFLANAACHRTPHSSRAPLLLPGDVAVLHCWRARVDVGRRRLMPCATPCCSDTHVNKPSCWDCEWHLLTFTAVGVHGGYRFQAFTAATDSSRSGTPRAVSARPIATLPPL